MRPPRMVESWDGSTPPPLGSDPVPAVPLPGRPADPERLREARSLFTTPPFEARLGPYAILTDLDDRALLASLGDVADQAESVYHARYGLALAGEAAETIVLYRDQASYRELQGRSQGIRGLASRGHVGWGLVALYAGEDAASGGLVAVLRHELGHVLNRRGMGPALPPWLDEGLADDFAAHELGPASTLREAPLASLRTVDGSTFEIRGALAGLHLLARELRAGTAPPLRSILAYDWTRFMEEPQATLHYAASAWLVRYLLDSRSGLEDEFRAFLSGVARGGRGEPEDLEAALGRPWSELEAGWRVYVEWRALGAGVGATTGGFSSRPAASPRASGSSSRQRDSPSA